MCGIAGFNFTNHLQAEKASQSISHRGPDDSGIFSDNMLTFIHRRLSILDLSKAGHQPMFYSPKTGACSSEYHQNLINTADTAIVFNGEIYNFKEIRKELLAKNYKFTSNCDTELVLAAYNAWGEDCVKKFNGMWAFCIYNRKTKKLFLSRDRLGIKPLYFYAEKGIFVFASEIKALLHAGVPFEINKDEIKHFFLLNTTSTGQTAVKGIQKLQPAENLIYDLTKKEVVRKTRYWQNRFTEEKISLPEAEKQIHESLKDSVRKRLQADTEVGAFLSGGIDSSLITALMSQEVGKIKTFSVGFDYADYDEAQYAKTVSEQYHTEHYELRFTGRDIKQLIDELPHYYDDPFGDASMIPTFLVSKVASEHVKVVLSGTGSDEIFGGYKRYQEFLLLSKLRRLSPLLKKPLSEIYALINSDKAHKLKELLKSEDDFTLYVKLLSDLFRGNDPVSADLMPAQKYRSNFTGNNKLNQILAFDQNVYLPEDLLIKEDRASMAHGLEGRVPFLDHRLVELANSLPVKYKMHRGQGKYILKQISRNYLPKAIIKRKKQGFGVPLKHYFRNELKDYAASLMFDFEDLPEYYDKTRLQKSWQVHQSGKADYSSLFWNIIMFNKWYDNLKHETI